MLPDLRLTESYTSQQPPSSVLPAPASWTDETLWIAPMFGTQSAPESAQTTRLNRHSQTGVYRLFPIRNRLDRKESKSMAKPGIPRAAQNALPGSGAPFRSGASHVHYSIQEHLPGLVNTACSLPDVEHGRDQLTRLVTSAFMAKYGVDMASVDARLALLEQGRQSTSEVWSAACKSEAETPEWLQTAKINDGSGNQTQTEVRWSDWQGRHKVESAVIAGLLPAALVASFVTAHSNLVGTGLPVFLENPVLPMTMAALAPMAGLSVKLMNGSFRTDRGHRRFTAGLNLTALGSVVCWIGLFAEQFHGLSSSAIGGGLFDEPSLWEEVRDTLFVAVTLFTEVAIGAVLANRLDRIALTYSPNYWVRNVESEAVQERVRKLHEALAGQTEELANLTGERTEYTNSLQLQIDLAMLAYDARRARIDSPDF